MENHSKRVYLRNVALGVFLLNWAAVGRVMAQSPSSAAATIFEKKCYSCHNIGGGDKKGPDLKGLTARRPMNWIREFVKTPSALGRRGDPDAAELLRKFYPEVMPDQDLTDEQVDALVALIDALTKKNETFVPAGARLSRAIVPGDAAAGLRIFTGGSPLRRGATACMACHHLSGAGVLGGGTLGPELTTVNIKYRDPELISILQNPNFPTMSSVFATHPLAEEEIVQLFALFQQSKQAAPVARLSTVGPRIEPSFLLIGTGALLFMLLVFNFLWRGRLRGVRESLVGRRPS
ncbi:MAG: c-type cytochrome [Acidobacteria bacterium]|nr:c-type cytochrome [Acidobacteriota bacterium]